MNVPEWIVKYWVEALFGAVVAGLTACYRSLAKRMKQKDEKEKALEDGVLALLHDRLYQACQYYIEKGFIDTAGLKNTEYLYRAYHALGGNGTGTELYNRAKALPIKED